MIIEKNCKEVLDKTEWIAIGTCGEEGVHLVGTWGDYIRQLGIEDDRIKIPVGGYFRTQEDLNKKNRVELLCATLQVQGTHGDGQGYRIVGKGYIETIGKNAELTKTNFPWSRGVLIIEVENIYALC